MKISKSLQHTLDLAWGVPSFKQASLAPVISIRVSVLRRKDTTETHSYYFIWHRHSVLPKLEYIWIVAYCSKRRLSLQHYIRPIIQWPRPLLEMFVCIWVFMCKDVGAKCVSSKLQDSSCGTAVFNENAVLHTGIHSAIPLYGRDTLTLLVWAAGYMPSWFSWAEPL